MHTEVEDHGNVELRFVTAHGRLGLPCWLAVPAAIDAECPPLVAVHGIKRDAKNQARLFGYDRASQGQLVIAPLFEQRQWPRYQQVVRRGRADLALLGLLNELRFAGLVNAETFELSGFSGGAQFAHRFAMLYPQMVRSLQVLAAGWYTFPDNAPFPYGLGLIADHTSLSPSNGWGEKMQCRLAEFLSMPIQIAIGSLDDERDSNFRTSREIDHQQGSNRVARASRWHTSLLAAARGLSLPEPDVRVEFLTGVAHDFSDCMAHGVSRPIATGSKTAKRGWV